jgi:hypothetical protein
MKEFLTFATLATVAVAVGQPVAQLCLVKP